MTSQSYRWLREPVREGVDAGAFSYAYPNNDGNDQWKIRELVLTKGLMQHELATFQVLSATGDEWPRWDPYTPVRIDYGNKGGNTTSFHGYVWRPDSEINQQVREPLNQRAMNFCALGASYPMKEGFSQVFTDKTASSIAQAVATNFKFNTNINNTTHVWDQLSSSGDSYFSFMCDLALRSGDFFFTDNTTLYFVEPLGLAKQMPAVPAYYSKDAIFPNPKVYNTATIISFTSDLSELNEEPGRTKANWTVKGVDLTTAKPFGVSDDGTTSFGKLVAGGQYGNKNAGRYTLPVFDRFAAQNHGSHPALVPNTKGDATHLIQTRAANNRFPIRATAELFGNVNLIPGMVISLHGLGSRNSGKWMIRSLTHRVVWKNWCSTEVELMRDSDFDPNPGGVEPSLIGPAKVIPTILVSGQWRAQYGLKAPTTLSAPVNIPNYTPAISPASTQSGNGTSIITTTTGQITNETQFADALLKQMGATPTTINVNMIVAWQQQEGQWGVSGGSNPYYAANMNNPLNLNPGLAVNQAGTYQGFAVTGLSGTISFKGNWTNGVAATVLTLQQLHPAIIQALKTSDTGLFFSLNGVDTWNPGRDPAYWTLVQSLYNSLP